MNDAYYRDKLSAYLDNQLPPDERQIVEQYLAEHPEAHAILDELRKLNAFVDAQAELRDDLYWEKSAKKIEALLGITPSEKVQAASSGKGWSSMRWTAVVATAASIAFITYIGLRDREHIEQKIQKQTQPPAAPMQKQTMNDSAVPQKDEMTSRSSGGNEAEVLDSLNVARSPKLQTVDKRPTLATDKDSAAQLQKKKEAPEETASGTVQETPSLAAPAPAMRSVERQTLGQSTEAEDQTVQTFSDSGNTASAELTSLRQQRDSLLAIGKASAVGVNSLTGNKKQSMFKRTLTAEKADRALLLPIWYRIAKQTPDTAERQMSIDSLRLYASGKNELLRSQANSYLDSLGVNRADSTGQK